MEARAHGGREDSIAAPPSERATPRARRAIAWALLVAGCAVGLAAWPSARETAVRSRESFGHGHLAYRDVETTIDPYLAAVAVAAPLAGIGSWAIVLAHPPRRRKLIFAALTVAVVGAAGGVTYAAVTGSQRLDFEPREYYAGVRDVAAEMARHHVSCTQATAAQIDSRYFAAALDCPIPAALAIEDGVDHASIRTWVSGDARDGWLRTSNPSEFNAVVGPT